MGFFSEIFKEVNDEVSRDSRRRTNVNRSSYSRKGENGYNEYDNDRWDKYEDNDFWKKM